ncbi:MAG: hypothetical protein GY765_21270, partial [bacterium]|nr:hypothetical protein [bacterium]
MTGNPRKFVYPGQLKRNIIILLLVSTLVLTLIFFHLADVGYREHKIRREKTTEHLVGELNDYISKIKGASGSIAANRYVITRLKTHPDISENEELNRDINGTLYSIKLTSDASIVYVMNRDGLVIASSSYIGGKTLTGNRYKFRPYFQEALAGKASFYAALGVTTNKRGLYIGSPILDGGKIIGVAVIKMALQKIDQLLYTPSFTAGIMSPQGIIFAANNPDWLFKAAQPIPQEELTKLKKTKQFGHQPLPPLPMDLTEEKISLGNKNYGVTRKRISLPGWQCFAVEKISGTYPFLMGCIAGLLIL